MDYVRLAGDMSQLLTQITASQFPMKPMENHKIDLSRCNAATNAPCSSPNAAIAQELLSLPQETKAAASAPTDASAGTAPYQQPCCHQWKDPANLCDAVAQLDAGSESKVGNAKKWPERVEAAAQNHAKLNPHQNPSRSLDDASKGEGELQRGSASSLMDVDLLFVHPNGMANTKAFPSLPSTKAKLCTHQEVAFASTTAPTVRYPPPPILASASDERNKNLIAAPCQGFPEVPPVLTPEGALTHFVVAPPAMSNGNRHVDSGDESKADKEESTTSSDTAYDDELMGSNGGNDDEESTESSDTEYGDESVGSHDDILLEEEIRHGFALFRELLTFYMYWEAALSGYDKNRLLALLMPCDGSAMTTAIIAGVASQVAALVAFALNSDGVGYGEAFADAVIHEEEIQGFALLRELLIFQIYSEEALTGNDKNRLLALLMPCDSSTVTAPTVTRVASQVQAARAALARHFDLDSAHSG
jgi:hypothetical protein